MKCILKNKAYLKILWHNNENRISFIKTDAVSMPLSTQPARIIVYCLLFIVVTPINHWGHYYKQKFHLILLNLI